MTDIIWSSDELMVRIDTDGDLEFTDNPSINTYFIRIDPNIFTYLSIYWLASKGYGITTTQKDRQ